MSELDESIDAVKAAVNKTNEPTTPPVAQTTGTSNRIQVDTTQVSQKAAGGGRIHVDTTQSLTEGVDHRVTKELKIEKKD